MAHFIDEKKIYNYAEVEIAFQEFLTATPKNVISLYNQELKKNKRDFLKKNQ